MWKQAWGALGRERAGPLASRSFLPVANICSTSVFKGPKGEPGKAGTDGPDGKPGIDVSTYLSVR